jgi:hypothetical protein
VGIVTVVLVVVVGVPALAASPEVVLDEPGVNETSSAASDGYLVWSASTDDKPNRSNSYLMAEGEDPVKLNAKGTHSYYVTIDGTTAVYQQGNATGDEFDDDLWFFDAITGERTEAPEGVNSGSLEFRPSLSGDHLLFTRSDANTVDFKDAQLEVVLFDLESGTETVLATLEARRNYLVSDQVNGDWATFESCRWSREQEYFDCQVTRYRISTEESVELPNPGVQQYAGALSADGTVYLTRQKGKDSWVCGKAAKIVRMPVDGPGTVIATLPEGKDALSSFAFDESDGSTTLYLDRLTCRKGRSGVYRIADADTTT